MKLSIITIHKGNELKLLIKTLRSIKRLRYHCSKIEFDQILVIKSEATIKTSNKRFFKVILNQDSSLYNAMNLGLKYSSGQKILFLNSGDQIYRKINYHMFQDQIFTNSCISFKVQIIYKDYYFTNNVNKKFKCHNSFIAPNNNKIYFKEYLKITSDAEWMEQNINKNGIVYSDLILVEYQGFGISDYPSFESAISYYKERGLTKFILRIIYLVSYKVIPRFIFFKLLAFKRGYHLKKNESN